MRRNYKLKVRLVIRGPFLYGGSGDTTRGLSRTFQRDSLGRPVILASHIKGKLLEAMKELSKANPNYAPNLDLFFGKRNDEGYYFPERGILHFNDFQLVDGSVVPTDSTLTRVSIHTLTRTAKEAFLQCQEKLIQNEGDSVWEGIIDFNSVEGLDPNMVHQHISTGFRWIAGFGADKGVGYGRLKSAEVSLEEYTRKPRAIQEGLADFKCFHLSIKLVDDLLIGGVRRKTNFIESEHIMSGRVLKGALAANLNRCCGVYPDSDAISVHNTQVARRFPNLTEFFSQIRFTHAFPAPTEATKRPVAIPLSIVGTSEKDQFADVALLNGPILDSKKRAPAFAPDWKDDSSIRREFGWANLSVITKTRTAIEPSTHSALQESLYTYQYISPYPPEYNGDVEDEKRKNVWLANIILPDISPEKQRPLAKELMEAVMSCWEYVGKGDSRIVVDLGPNLVWQKIPTHESGFVVDGKVVLVLQTDAPLIDPSDLSGVKDKDKLRQLYEQFWNRTSRGSLELTQFFAAQKLEGGYLHFRYTPGTDYYPYFLTKAGSTFVFRSRNEEAAKQVLQAWYLNGLPVPEWVLKKFKQKEDQLWQVFPFVPTNGYGEIVVNLEWHWKRLLTGYGLV
ncbi:MAG: hypothetical protein HXY46_08630 [Syntrophaceae bacterium]|nr:hypothetical protein [Syntrophaceae bacterium]